MGLTFGDNVLIIALAVIALLAYVTYVCNKPKPYNKDQDEAERRERETNAKLLEERRDKERQFALEMAKLGYVQKSVLSNERIDEDEDEYGPRRDIQRDWQLAWVKDEEKAADVLTSTS